MEKRALLDGGVDLREGDLSGGLGKLRSAMRAFLAGYQTSALQGRQDAADDDGIGVDTGCDFF